jgi:flagella basal body P-ring formation protein FlgA
MMRGIVPLAFAITVANVAPAGAATLRTLVTLNAPVVKLSDLFDDAGSRADRVLGPAPAPGGRIVVESAQLAAIARQFGVDWRPASSADRAVLDRPGRLLPRASITAPLLAALTRVGAPADVGLDIPGFDPPLVPAESEPAIVVEQVDYEGATGHFTGVVLITGQSIQPMRLRLTGEVYEVAHVLVPTRRLNAGTVVRPGDLIAATVRADSLRGEVARDPSQVLGEELRRPVQPGGPVLLADLRRPLAVDKGGRVTMEVHLPGLTVIAEGTALAGGALGDWIEVLNPVSNLAVSGQVIGPGRVAVASDSVPAPAGRPGATTTAPRVAGR